MSACMYVYVHIYRHVGQNQLKLTIYTIYVCVYV